MVIALSVLAGLLIGLLLGRVSVKQKADQALPVAQLDSLAGALANADRQFAPCPPEITTYIAGEDLSSTTETIDFVREYVYEHSDHKIDGEWKKYAFDMPRVLAMLNANQKSGAPKPHLSCGPRALAMGSILSGLGIKVRLVHIFNTTKAIDSHTFLDVFNSDEGRWETHDPDFDVYYCWKGSDTRLSTLQIVLGDVEVVQPHSSRGVGWTANKIDHLRSNYFGAVM